jgi:GrpB-like predicted nucleotidyltransferase (UPF0157 family)
MIELSEYNRDWPNQFAELRERLSHCLGDVAVAIEHVGSTAVPGLAAKPLIDIDGVIPLHAKIITIIGRLARIGYVHQGNLGIEGREVFRAPTGPPAHHLYVCRRGCVALRNHLTLRDHLRRHPDDVAAYARLKKILVAQCADVDEYTRRKTDFIVSILARYNSFSEAELETIRRSNE